MGLAALAALKRLGVGLAPGRRGDEEQLAALGIAPGRCHPFAQVGAERLHLADRADRGDDRIHVLGGELLALRRAAGLHQHRAALRRARGGWGARRGGESGPEWW